MSKLITFLILFSGITLLNSEFSVPDEANDIFCIMPENNSIFSYGNIPEDIYKNMLGNSIPLKYEKNVNTNSLSFLKISYYGFDGLPHVGEMIVNSKIAEDVLDIFKELFEIKYPIEKIKLIDEYGADDELSMSDNNTSCFCYRVISNSTVLSKHAKGLAIDINPLYNPYVVKGAISPVSGSVYANRNLNNKYQISKNDTIYNIFKKHGWSWGGDWPDRKDYQHFEKSI